jgi:phosphatidylglycerol:prolipoprotein diacylglycerol transferase
MLVAPAIDPVALTLWGHPVRWYSLAYMAGLLFIRRRLERGLGRNVDLFLLGAVLSMYLWGRGIFELVYDANYALAHPLEVMRPSGGGLSFHGSLIGIALATYAAARLWRIPFLAITDEICTAAPLGIALGRLGNFVNQELFGRVTDVAWGVVFPSAGPEPRHPSQLYESFLEGWLLLAVMLWVSRRSPETGTRTALFLAL